MLRYRRAHGVQRQQLKWFYAGLILALVVPLAVAFWYHSVLVQVLVGLSFNAMPLAIGAAILRYRLYDIDRILSRTLAWALLTVVLGLGYAGVVLGLSWLLPQGSSLAVAAATLTVAAVFQPVRRRIQTAVDRRFNRRRYDAARTIQTFSGRLRQQVDLDTLTGQLLAVVDDTRQPIESVTAAGSHQITATRLSGWRQPADGSLPRAGWARSRPARSRPGPVRGGPGRPAAARCRTASRPVLPRPAASGAVGQPR